MQLARRRIGGVEIGRLVTGLWQMADQERDGRAFDLDAAAMDLAAYARAGLDTFDMADHYGSAEIVAGMVAKAMREAGETPPTILTKWCPAPGPMPYETVRAGVETALERLQVETIDVMQFHWWRYEDFQYLDALTHLMRLRQEGLVREVGLTNFDAAHLRLLRAHGIEVASNQVSFSLLDRRASGDLAAAAAEHGVALLAFGTLAGGLLSARWLDAAEPAPDDWSRMKWKRFVDTAGGWRVFQALLRTLADVARKHHVTLSNVATAWTLAQPGISATIIGARLTEAEHRDANLRAAALDLDADDLAAIDAATTALDPIPGDCGDEYRRPPFLTASGDLSHHLDALPPVFPIAEMPARPGRMRATTGSIWEAKCGFSRAVRVKGRILVSGTTATTPAGEDVAPGDVFAQTIYALDKAVAAITSLGGAVEDVVRTTLYLRNAADWERASAAHARIFDAVRPANTLIGGIDLIGAYLVEVEVEAEVDG